MLIITAILHFIKVDTKHSLYSISYTCIISLFLITYGKIHSAFGKKEAIPIHFW